MIDPQAVFTPEGLAKCVRSLNPIGQGPSAREIRARVRRGHLEASRSGKWLWITWGAWLDHLDRTLAAPEPVERRPARSTREERVERRVEERIRREEERASA